MKKTAAMFCVAPLVLITSGWLAQADGARLQTTTASGKNSYNICTTFSTLTKEQFFRFVAMAKKHRDNFKKEYLFNLANFSKRKDKQQAVNHVVFADSVLPIYFYFFWVKCLRNCLYKVQQNFGDTFSNNNPGPMPSVANILTFMIKNLTIGKVNLGCCMLLSSQGKLLVLFNSVQKYCKKLR
jgi:hypothetical protein